jgi:hypothetical protein
MFQSFAAAFLSSSQAFLPSRPNADTGVNKSKQSLGWGVGGNNQEVALLPTSQQAYSTSKHLIIQLP